MSMIAIFVWSLCVGASLTGPVLWFRYQARRIADREQAEWEMIRREQRRRGLTERLTGPRLFERLTGPRSFEVWGACPQCGAQRFHHLGERHILAPRDFPAGSPQREARGTNRRWLVTDRSCRECSHTWRELQEADPT